MRKIALLSTLVLSTLTHAWTLDGLGDFRFKALSDTVFVMHGPLADPNTINQGFMNNPGFVIGANGLIVIDPGATKQVGEHVIQEIEKITKKPIVAVFNTHIHGDHWLGNQAIIAQYPNAKIYAHPNMITRAKEGEGDNWVAILNTLTAGLSKGTKAVYPTNAVLHLQNINIEGETFKIHSPTSKAHTDTDIMVEHVNSKTLFLGDNDFYQRMGRFDNSSDMHGNIKVLQYAIDLGLSHYVPGHGQSGNANQAVKPFLDYLKRIKQATIKGYDADLADYEIKPLADKKLTPYHSWGGYHEQLGKHINKMLLEIEALDL